MFRFHLIHQNVCFLFLLISFWGKTIKRFFLLKDLENTFKVCYKIVRPLTVANCLAIDVLSLVPLPPAKIKAIDFIEL